MSRMPWKEIRIIMWTKCNFSKYAENGSPLERHFGRSSGLYNFERLLGARLSRSSETFLARVDSVNSGISRIVIEVQI